MTAPCKAPAHPAPSEAGTVPSGLVCVPLEKNCLLLLTAVEYARAIRRGKWWRRQEAMRRREGTG